MPLTNPVNAQNIIDFFASTITPNANSGIVWGTNALPMHGATTVVGAAYFGGTTAGRAVGATGTTVTGGSVGPVSAAAIYNTLLTEAVAFTAIRRLNAVLVITGSGTVYNQTNKAYMNTSYQQPLTVAAGGVAAGSPVSSATLTTLITDIAAALTNAQNTVVNVTTTVCHSSCHSSCHGSCVFSDARLKTNVKLIDRIEGVNVYRYNYIWGGVSQVGIMAQELIGTAFETAVVPHKTGFLQVDYSQLPFYAVMQRGHA